jgi:FkbM family methyltransferase
LKKLLRSMLVFAPWIQDLRFATESRLLRATRRPFRAEFAGLRALRLSDPVVLDVGLNRGIAAETIRTMMPTAWIVGFEANPDLAEATAARLRSDRRIDVRAVALGSSAATGTLYIPVYRGYRFDGYASFDRAFATKLFDRHMLYGFDPAHLVVKSREVPLRSLDDEGLEPDVVKLYVQGHERPVLEGAAKTLAAHEPIVLAPSRNAEVDTFLREAGYGRYQWVRDRFVAEDDSGYVVYYATPARARATGMTN